MGCGWGRRRVRTRVVVLSRAPGLPAMTRAAGTTSHQPPRKHQKQATRDWSIEAQMHRTRQQKRLAWTGRQRGHPAALCQAPLRLLGEVQVASVWVGWGGAGRGGVGGRGWAERCQPQRLLCGGSGVASPFANSCPRSSGFCAILGAFLQHMPQLNSARSLLTRRWTPAPPWPAAPAPAVHVAPRSGTG
jgi:hypothetical protein